MDYKFGNKNQWRRTWWNRITERLSVKPAEAVVLYLAGTQDLDRAEALRRGFKDYNLIAIERQTSTVRALRDSGSLCIEGDLIDIINAFDPGREAHVIIGDMTCGLELRLVHAVRPWINERSSFRRAVFAFNMLRGRDPSGNPIRNIWDSNPDSEKVMRLAATLGVEWFLKHRGRYLFQTMFEQFLFAQGIRETGPDGMGRVPEARRPEAEKAMNFWMTAAGPYFTNYRSAAQTFDGVVLRNPYQFLPDNPKRDERIESEKLRSEYSGPIRRKIAAVMAHRTMRMN